MAKLCVELLQKLRLSNNKYDKGASADFLKIKKRTTYHFVATRNIPHYRVGRLIRFKLSEIEEWMNKNKSEQLNVPYGELESI